MPFCNACLQYRPNKFSSIVQTWTFYCCSFTLNVQLTFTKTFNVDLSWLMSICVNMNFLWCHCTKMHLGTCQSKKFFGGDNPGPCFTSRRVMGRRQGRMGGEGRREGRGSSFKLLGDYCSRVCWISWNPQNYKNECFLPFLLVYAKKCRPVIMLWYFSELCTYTCRMQIAENTLVMAALTREVHWKLLICLYLPTWQNPDVAVVSLAPVRWFVYRCQFMPFVFCGFRLLQGVHEKFSFEGSPTNTQWWVQTISFAKCMATAVLQPISWKQTIVAC